MSPSAASSPLKVLFVCVGNSCRSQMAEALANHLGQGHVRAYSAGSHPLGDIIEQTYETMAEKGISLDGQWSKGLKDVPVAEMDVVVGMGCEVDCPIPQGFKGRKIDWNIPDPFGRGEVYFRSVRDTIERHVTVLLADLERQRKAGTVGDEPGSPEVS